ncbi:MAG: hypothetical protein QXG18_01055 [Candidatus Pacearchaeota archaeon]
MLEEINKEKTSADHLFYVSLKYTKTCDVILNLIERWRSLIEICFDVILKKCIKDKKLKKMPSSPKHKIEFIEKNFKKFEEIKNIIPIYLLFKKIPSLQKIREGEFRKKVNLKVIENNKTIDINLIKLKEYHELVEKFISLVKQRFM